ncbi:MAG: molybdopterin molybdenumtransferase MoeA, partial [Candidatus Aureabacteria bacterium]|nr:molybdopterin molybdenumtransferase MoeA [Candidatus Auribacterota bacterium]
LLFVRPALLRMQGKESLRLPEEKAIMREGVDEISARTQLVRAVVIRRGGKLYAKPTGPQGSGILKSLVLANALLLVPPGRRLKKGARVRALLLD